MTEVEGFVPPPSRASSISLLSSVVRELAVSVEPRRGFRCAGLPLPRWPLENCRASTSINKNLFFQATKGQRWMPWRQEPMKDVGDCEKLREAVDQALIRRCPNGETRHPSWGVTLV